VVGDALEFSFQVLKKGTLAEYAELEVETEAGYCGILRDVPQHSERNHSSLMWRHFKPDFKTADPSSF